MIIPLINLQKNLISKKTIELAKKLNRFSPVTIIDIDAVMEQGDNLDIIKEICKVAEVRVGGGIRDLEKAKELLKAGADKIIIGTNIDIDFLDKLDPSKVIIALDHKEGEVVDKGWTRETLERVVPRAKRLLSYTNEFLITDVFHEGTLLGIDIGLIKNIRASIPHTHKIVFSGGVRNHNDIIGLPYDFQVCSTLYDSFDLIYATIEGLDWVKMKGLMPTVVQDNKTGQVLSLVYSTKESLAKALAKGKGIYWSRSRQKIWEKGETLGNTQELISFRTDCDKDSILFRVNPNGSMCKTGNHSCFGEKRFTIHDLIEIILRKKSTLGNSIGSYTHTLLREPSFRKMKIENEAREISENEIDHQWEYAELLYHIIVDMVARDISWEDITYELERRHLLGDNK